MFRKLLKIHLWLGVLMSIPLVIVSVTGALLVFGPELQAKLSPQEWYADTPGEPLPFETLLQRFDEQLPGVQINVMALDQPPGHAWRFWLGGGQGVANVDPVTGEVLKHYQNNETAYGYVLQLHRWLLAPRGDLRPWIRDLVSAVALLFMLQLIGGIWLWLIPPRRWSRLKITLDGNRRKLMSRLHSLTGLSLAGVLLLIAFTGIAFNWRQPVQQVVKTLSASDIRDVPDITAGGHDGTRNIDNAVAMALRHFPDGRVLSVNVPKENNQPVKVRIAQPGILNATIVAVDPVTAELLHIQRPEEKTRAETFMGINYKLHIGDFAGTWVRALWVIVALVPVFYVYSGLWIYLRRTRSKRQRAREEKQLSNMGTPFEFSPEQQPE